MWDKGEANVRKQYTGQPLKPPHVFLKKAHQAEQLEAELDVEGQLLQELEGPVGLVDGEQLRVQAHQVVCAKRQGQIGEGKRTWAPWSAGCFDS